MGNFSDPEQVCEQILAAIGHRSPPTDLDAVCSLWPDLSVDEEDLDKEGYLIPFGVHGAEILLRRKDPSNRKKFTLAHELGHWTLAHLKAGQLLLGTTGVTHLSFRTNHKVQTSEEIWCNKFAACLLMPISDVRKYLQDTGHANLTSGISRGPSVFQVSQEAFLNRIADTTPINIFEVVVADGNARVRRRFPSKYRPDEQSDSVMRMFLDNFCMTDQFLDEQFSDEYRVQALLTHNSQYSRNWLVSVSPQSHIGVE